MTDYWTTVGIAAFVGFLTSGVVAVWGISRNIKHKSVIDERQKWRDSLRQLIPELVGQVEEKSRARIRDSVALRLNPYHDAEAIRLLDRVVVDPAAENGAAVVGHFQDLLKRDWERAKIEATWLPFRAASRADRIVDRQRDASLMANPPSGPN